MDHGLGQPIPGASVLKSLTRPDLAHTGPQQPGTVCRTAPGHASDPASRNTGTGSDLGFEWQVLGSNQRRLSRRFYSEPIPAHRNIR